LEGGKRYEGRQGQKDDHRTWLAGRGALVHLLAQDETVQLELEWVRGLAEGASGGIPLGRYSARDLAADGIDVIGV
jgi:hypothetical protein